MKKQGLWIAGVILSVCVWGAGCGKGENTSRLAFLYNQASISMMEGNVSEPLIREIQNLQELEVEETEGTYITAYNQFLKEYEIEFKKENNKNNWEAFKFVNFNLVYIDDDEIPELVIDDWGKVRFYTYCSGKVKELGEFWEYESIEYEEKTGIIRLIFPEEYRWIRTYTETYYQLEDGEIKQIVQLYSSTWFNDDYIEHPSFEIDDNSVSEETFQIKKRELEEKYDFILIDEGVPVSEAPVLETYRRFLTYYAKQKKDKDGQGETRFALIYLDGDEIPELVILEGDAHMDAASVYTYEQGRAVLVGRYGQHGTMYYQEKEGIVLSDFDSAGEVLSSVYQIDGTNEVTLQSYHTQWGKTEGKESYFVDNEKTTKEQYDKVWEKWNSKANRRVDYRIGTPVSEDNWEALIKQSYRLRTGWENYLYFFQDRKPYSYKAKFTGLSGEALEEPVETVVTLDIREVKYFDKGTLFELRLVPDEELKFRYDMERLNLGYFYVNEDKIYCIRDKDMSIEAISEEEIKSRGRLVCQREETKDLLGEKEKGWHEYISTEGFGRHIYHGYDTLVETGWYEQFVWEWNKGLVQYRSGFGAEADAIELELVE